MIINNRFEEPYKKFAPEGPIPVLSKTLVKSRLSKKFWKNTQKIYDEINNQDIENLDFNNLNNANNNNLNKLNVVNNDLEKEEIKEKNLKENKLKIGKKKY